MSRNSAVIVARFDINVEMYVAIPMNSIRFVECLYCLDHVLINVYSLCTHACTLLVEYKSENCSELVLIAHLSSLKTNTCLFATFIRLMRFSACSLCPIPYTPI